MRLKSYTIGNWRIDFKIGTKYIDFYRLGSFYKTLDVTRLNKIYFNPGRSQDDLCNYIFEADETFTISDSGRSVFMADEILSVLNKRLDDMYKNIINGSQCHD